MKFFRHVSFGVVVLKQGVFNPQDWIILASVNKAIVIGYIKQAGRDCQGGVFSACFDSSPEVISL